MYPTFKNNEQDEFEKVYCADLVVGMYVVQLDRPWLETPFMFQGCYVTSDEDIEAFKKYCNYVYIDKAYEEIDVNIVHACVDYANKARKCESASSRTIRTTPVTANSSRYTVTTAAEKELKVAEDIYTESMSVVEQLYACAHRDGKLDTNKAHETTTSIVSSVLRNPDAFLLLQSIKNKDLYGYTHAINCCALAATFCRHLGFEEETIHEISMGALMLDVGVTRLTESMLRTKVVNSPVSMNLPPNHVELGVDVLENTPNIPPVVREMVQSHHERINGGGYPQGLKGDQIPVSGCIAAIVDCYDAMTSARPDADIVMPVDAICAMYNLRNIDYHESLIEHFIQCIGTYPTGATVELTSGQVGVVIAQNRQRRLYPKVLLTMDEYGKRYNVPHLVDLWEYSQTYKGVALTIKRIVNAKNLGIQPSDCFF